MSPPPSLVWVPGAWHSSCFQKVIDILSSHGYESTSLHLPSVGGSPVVKDMEPDKNLIRSTVTKLVEEGKDVIVVSHSYGGLPANSSLEGLSKTERTKAGKKGGVIKSCMISAFLLDVGKSLLGGKEPAPWVTQDGETLFPHDTDKVFYSDLPAEEAAYWHAKLLPHARASFEAPTTYAAWKVIPVHYLLCEQDQGIPLAFQQKMCDDAREAGGSIETEGIATSHSPFLSQPEVVANWIRRAAGEEIAKERA